MMMRKLRIEPGTDDAYLAPGLLAHLKTLKGFKVTDPGSDIRGWTLSARDGRRVGVIDDLIVETSTLEVRYLEVRIDQSAAKRAGDVWVLVPARVARVDDLRERVIIDSMSAEGIAEAPRSMRSPPNPVQERAIRDHFAPSVRAIRSDDEDTLDYERFWEPRRHVEPRYSAPDGSAQQGLTKS
jgi:sporulation protein YlmC with PRC-barrel domain